MLKAQRQFRRIIGYADLAKLITAIERELDQPTRPPRPRKPPPPPPCNHHTRDRHREVPRRADISTALIIRRDG